MKLVYQTGMTLIELLIAMVIASFLMAGVFNVYLSIYSSDTTNEHLSLLQQNGRYAIDSMTKDIRMAGYTGCTSESTLLLNLVGSGDVGAFSKNLSKAAVESNSEIDNSVLGWEASGTAFGETIPKYTSGSNNVAITTLKNGIGAASLTLDVTDKSDALQVWGAKGATVKIDSVSGNVLTLSDSGVVSKDDFIAVSNCKQKAIIAKVCSVSGSDITLDSTCNSNFGAGLNLDEGDVIRVFSSLYYVSRVNGRDSPSLFRATLDGNGDLQNTNEIAEGVESMQIMYGLNTDEDDVAVQDKKYDADVYAPAELMSPRDWKNVVSVQISLLMVSIDDGVSTHSIPYVFNGAAQQTPSDKRLRRVFTKTIALRNRVL